MQCTKIFLLPLFVFNLCVNISLSLFKCAYQPPNADEVLLGVVTNSVTNFNGVPDEPHIRHGRHRKRQARQHMRFKAVFDSSIEKIEIKQIQSYIKDELIPNACKFWSDVLSVDISSYPIKLERRCNPSISVIDGMERKVCIERCPVKSNCGEVEIPAAHLTACYECKEQDCKKVFEEGEGVPDADFILYVSAIMTDRCQKSNETIAYAAHCGIDGRTGRPIAGHTNICPRALNGSNTHNRHMILATVKHEIMHALAFSTSLFNKFINDRGHPYKNTRKNYTLNDWWVRKGTMSHPVQYFITPRVVAAAREHFGCDTLQGAELENQGSDGTASTHWEKRIFENEAMTGTHTQNPVFSNISLALLQDTGWYEVDYGHAEPLKWGYKMGCDFVLKSCGEWIATRRAKNMPVSPFCDIPKRNDGQPTRNGCTLDRDSVGTCNLRHYDEPLPDEYQNFRDLGNLSKNALGFYGGAVELADFCPFYHEFEYTSQGKTTPRYRDSRCHLAENAVPDEQSNGAMEELGPNSRCFLHGDKFRLMHCQEQYYHETGSGCHNHVCEDGKVWLVLPETNFSIDFKFPCYKEGQIIYVNRIWKKWSHHGRVICPSCKDMCPKNFSCAPETEPPRFVGDRAQRVPCRGTSSYYYQSSFIGLTLALLTRSFYMPFM